MLKKVLPISLLAIGATAGTAQAELIAADSFNTADYGTTTTGLNGLDPAIPGFSGAWNVGTGNLQFDAGGTLLHPSVTYEDDSTGKARFLASGFDFYRAGNRGLAAYTPADTYYMSFLVNPGSGLLASPNVAQHQVIGFTNFISSQTFTNAPGAPEGYGLFTGFTGDTATGEVDLIVRARDSAGDLADTVLLDNIALNQTYLVLLKLDVNAGGGSTDQVTYWVNPENLNLGEAGITGTTGTFGTFAMDANNRIDRFSAIWNNYDGGSFFDEIRFGTDLVSVTGVPIPEPASLAILGGLGLAALARRRNA